MQTDLFKHDYGEGGKEIEDVEITTTILYLSRQELKEFKQLCKHGIKEMYGQEFQAKGNLPDFLLTILRERYANKKDNSEASH